jgi:hypothetical protein
VYRPFVSGFDGIERRSALMRRNPIFADILGSYATASLTHTTPDSDQLTSASTSRVRRCWPRFLTCPAPASSTMPLAAADRISEGPRAPLAPTCLGCAHDHREATMSFLGELGGLGTSGDAVHPRRARNFRRVHFAYAVSAAVLFREDVLRAVVFADRLGPGTHLERH